MTSLPASAHPALGSLLVQSWRLLRAHPVVAAALGSAVLFSLAAVLFGVGIFTTPWFVCEVFALQLSILTGRPTERSLAWVRAAVFVLGTTGLVLAATWLAALAIGPDVSTADSASGPLPWPEALRRVGRIAAVTGLTVGFIAPFQYAPLILIERRGTVGAAVLESAWLVRRGGLLRHWLLCFAAHLLPLAPALAAAVVVARTFERAATPIGILIGLPLMVLTIPLGQGLLSAAYTERRRELAEPRWTRREGKPPRALVALLVALVLVPMLSVALLAVGALRPAPPSQGLAPAGRVVLSREVVGASTLYIPHTTLSLHVDGRRLRVVAPDGAEVRPSQPWREPISRVRARRVGDRYMIEIGAERWWWIEVGRGGIRTDDSIAERLRRRLPGWAMPAIGAAFALNALLLIRALEPLGMVRRLYGAPASDRPPLAELQAQRVAAIRTAWGVGLSLVAPTAAGLVAGLMGLLG